MFVRVHPGAPSQGSFVFVRFVLSGRWVRSGFFWVCLGAHLWTLSSLRCCQVRPTAPCVLLGSISGAPAESVVIRPGADSYVVEFVRVRV